MEDCRFWTDNRTPASRVHCGTHGDRPPMECAWELGQKLAHEQQHCQTLQAEIEDLRRLMGPYSTVEVALKAQEKLREAASHNSMPTCAEGCDSPALYCDCIKIENERCREIAERDGKDYADLLKEKRVLELQVGALIDGIHSALTHLNNNRPSMQDESVREAVASLVRAYEKAGVAEKRNDEGKPPVVFVCPKCAGLHKGSQSGSWICKCECH